MPPSKEVTLGHHYDTVVAVVPSRVMNGHIVTVRFKLNFLFGLFCLMEN